MGWVKLRGETNMNRILPTILLRISWVAVKGMIEVMMGGKREVVAFSVGRYGNGGEASGGLGLVWKMRDNQELQSLFPAQPSARGGKVLVGFRNLSTYIRNLLLPIHSYIIPAPHWYNTIYNTIPCSIAWLPVRSVLTETTLPHFPDIRPPPLPGKMALRCTSLSTM